MTTRRVFSLMKFKIYPHLHIFQSCPNDRLGVVAAPILAPGLMFKTLSLKCSKQITWTAFPRALCEPVTNMKLYQTNTSYLKTVLKAHVSTAKWLEKKTERKFNCILTLNSVVFLNLRILLLNLAAGRSYTYCPAKTKPDVWIVNDYHGVFRRTNRYCEVTVTSAVAFT